MLSQAWGPERPRLGPDTLLLLGAESARFLALLTADSALPVDPSLGPQHTPWSK